jgi:SAM-dependent methyltransferase
MPPSPAASQPSPALSTDVRRAICASEWAILHADSVAPVTEGPLDYVKVNATAWDARHEGQLETARGGWTAVDPRWGIFGVPEDVARLLPVELEGARTVELGCGTAYVSAWLARRGAQPVGVDPAAGQLGIARQFQDEFSLRFPLVRAAGEQVRTPATRGAACPYPFVDSEWARQWPCEEVWRARRA